MVTGQWQRCNYKSSGFQTADTVGFVREQVQAVCLEAWIPEKQLRQRDAELGFEDRAVVARDGDIIL